MQFKAAVKPAWLTGRFNRKILLVMKFVTILLFAGAMHVSANGLAQKISIRMKDAPLVNVFNEIKRQTDFTIFYNYRLLENAKRVTLDLKDASVEDVLKTSLKDQPLTYSIVERSIVIKLRDKDFADLTKQLLTPLLVPVSGKITDELGTPLSGVSITISNKSAKGTSTDATGSFNIEVDDGDILTISSVEYLGITVKIIRTGTGAFTASVIKRENPSSETKKEKRSDTISGINEIKNLSRLSVLAEYQDGGGNSQNTSTLNIHFILFKKDNTLDELMINTGYETLPKERATGSFEKVDKEVLSMQPHPNIISRLNGMVSGMLFDANPRRPAYTIRGISSIQGSSAPLIVLDNFPYDGDVNNINPEDVESVTVLKDAAAASIWGAKAGNGVIVITTKKGKYNSPLNITANVNLNYQTLPDLHYSPNFIASPDYIAIEKELFSKGYFTTAENDRNKPALSPAVELMIAFRDGKIDAATLDSKLTALGKIDYRNQARDVLLQPAISQQYHVSVSGGTGKTAHYFSAGYARNVNEYSAINDRITIRTENKFKLSNKFDLGVSIQLSQLENQTGKPLYDDITVASKKLPYIQLVDDNDSAMVLAKVYRQTYTDTAGNGKLLPWTYYPSEDWKHDKKNTTSHDMRLGLDLKWQPLPGLQAMIQYQYGWQHTGADRLQTIESYAARSMINLFSQLNRSTGVVTYAVPKGAILDRQTSDMQLHNLRTQFRYDKKIGNHQINALAGWDISQTVTISDRSLSYGYDPEVLTTSKVDYVNAYTNFVTGSSQFIPDGQSYSSTNNRFVSLYANAGYQYQTRYLLNLSVRKDASNLFGVESNEKGVPLWSAGVGWIVSKESFLKTKAISFLKIRLTTGVGGNVDQTKSAYTIIQYIGTATSTNLQAARITQFGNPSLRWEKMYTTNLGVDFELFKSRIRGSLEIYQKIGKDLFGGEPLDATTGLNREVLTTNVASTKGKGVDVNISSLNCQGTFEWQSNLLFSYNSSRVTSYYISGTPTGRSLVASGHLLSPREGEKVYRITSYAWAGLDPQTAAPRGYLDGQPSMNYAAILGASTTIDNVVDGGSSIPEFFGSFINSLKWKNLVLQISLSYRMGYSYRRSVISYTNLFAGGPGHEEFYFRWQRPGDEKITNVPAMNYPANSSADEFYQNSEVTVVRGDHIRIQFVNLEYQPFPNQKNGCIKNLRVRCSAGNLGVIWKKDNSRFDPDYPVQKVPPSFNMGISTNF